MSKYPPITYVDLDVDKILRMTEKAVQVLLVGGEELWIPKSQIKDPADLDIGATQVTLSIAEWFAKQKDLIPED